MTNTSYCGFPANQYGFVEGVLPPGMTLAGNVVRSDQIRDAGYDVYVLLDTTAAVACGNVEPDKEQIHLRDWCPEPPDGDGWRLAWRAENEDGEANVVWWRPRQGQAATHEVVDAF